MFLMFARQKSLQAAAFIDDIQRNGGLRVGMPNMMSEAGMKALEDGDVVIIPLGMAPGPQAVPVPDEPKPEESPGPVKETEQSSSIVLDTK